MFRWCLGSTEALSVRHPKVSCCICQSPLLSVCHTFSELWATFASLFPGTGSWDPEMLNAFPKDTQSGGPDLALVLMQGRRREANVPRVLLRMLRSLQCWRWNPGPLHASQVFCQWATFPVLGFLTLVQARLRLCVPGWSHTHSSPPPGPPECWGYVRTTVPGCFVFKASVATEGS